MRNVYFFLFTLLFLPTAFGATSPASVIATNVGVNATQSNIIILDKASVKINKNKKPTLLQKAKLKLLTIAQSKGLLVEGEMTEKQKRKAKWSMILGLSSILLLFIPHIGLIAIPTAIVGLVLGIKSVQGNSNTKGIIGIIASGLTLLLLLLGIILLAVFLATWN